MPFRLCLCTSTTGIMFLGRLFVRPCVASVYPFVMLFPSNLWRVYVRCWIFTKLLSVAHLGTG